MNACLLSDERFLSLFLNYFYIYEMQITGTT